MASLPTEDRAPAAMPVVATLGGAATVKERCADSCGRLMAANPSIPFRFFEKPSTRQFISDIAGRPVEMPARHFELLHKLLRSQGEDPFRTQDRTD
jgi:hypothetical protein